MDKNEKYVVFKREDWERYQRILADPDPMMPTPLVPIDDAVVIRRQDIFAPPAFAVYANSIRTAFDVARLNEVGEPNETAKRLQGIADYFHEQSELAYADSARKLPD